MEARGALPILEQFLLRHGVTSYLPTTVTAPLDQTLAALDRLGEAIHAQTGGAVHDGLRHVRSAFI